MKRLLATWLTGSMIACAPLTLSNDGAIDFERYRSALVQGDGADYLADELRSTSGFERVTTDVSVEVDLVIVVSVFVAPDVECECDDGCECDCDCTCETHFDATASYAAMTPGGAVVDQGSETDTSGTEIEAVEDALDEVALHYFRPYRL